VVLQFKVSATGPGAGRLQGVGETNFYTVFFRNPNTGWIGGAGGRLMSTQDGGLTWNTQTFQVPQGDSDGDSAIRAILFLTDQNGVAIVGGKALVYTDNGGKDWKSLGFPANVLLESLTYSGQTLWLSGGRKLTPTLTVAMLWRSDDFGKTWNNVPVGDLYGAITSAWFADASTGFIAVKGKAYQTQDGGATWTEKSDGSVAIEKIVGADAHTLWGLAGGAVYRYTSGTGFGPATPGGR
jgi:photosystem II stability/assembly factor-like uncharacterized protein